MSRKAVDTSIICGQWPDKTEIWYTCLLYEFATHAWFTAWASSDENLGTGAAFFSTSILASESLHTLRYIYYEFGCAESVVSSHGNILISLAARVPRNVCFKVHGQPTPIQQPCRAWQYQARISSFMYRRRSLTTFSRTCQVVTCLSLATWNIALFWDVSLTVAWKCHIEVSDLWMECICSFICNQVWIPALWLTLFCLQKKLRSVAHTRLLWAFHIGQGELSSSTKSQWNAMIFGRGIVHAMVLGILEYGLLNQLGIVSFYVTSREALLWTEFFRGFTW